MNEFDYSHAEYRGNTLLRPAGTALEYTEEQVLEYYKCKNDPIYFMRNYVKVLHIDKGPVLFDLRDYQEEFIGTIQNNNKVIAMLARQMGKSITTCMYILWYVIFNPNKTAAIAANKASIAKELIHRIKFAYENLPKWLQQGITSWNKQSIELENGSRIISAATSSSGLRGYTINLLMLDEFAFLSNNTAEDFFTSMFPTLSSGKDTKIIITSTPNGYNHFWNMWDGAGKGTNGFVQYFAPWWRVPERDEKWKNDQLATLGAVKFSQEVGCSFIGSSYTLISGDTLSKITTEQPISETDGLMIYEFPEKDHSYVMTVDTSRGQYLDDSAFIVFDVTETPYKVVAKYNKNNIPIIMYPNIIFNVATKYNDAYVLIEINDAGEAVSNHMYYDLEYENMFWTKGEFLGKSGNPYPGIRTTKRTKRIGCDNTKTFIESNKLIIRDKDILSQLSTFTQVRDSYAADEGYKDDLVMCLVLFGWLANQPFFVDLTNNNIRSKILAERENEIDQYLTPFGFMDNGNIDEIDTSDLIGVSKTDQWLFDPDHFRGKV